MLFLYSASEKEWSHQRRMSLCPEWNLVEWNFPLKNTSTEMEKLEKKNYKNQNENARKG